MYQCFYTDADQMTHVFINEWNSFYFYSLTDSFRTWANEMHILIITEELANDLIGAELLIRRHEEYKYDIEKQWLKYEDLQQAGSSLAKTVHFMSLEVS